jgi:hypothetical protein
MPTNTDSFSWEVQPVAARWVQHSLDALTQRNPLLESLARLLRSQTGTRLVDWTDYLLVSAAEQDRVRREVTEVGYRAVAGEVGVYRHARGMFPAVACNQELAGVAIRVEQIELAQAALTDALQLPPSDPGTLHGSPGGRYRHAIISNYDGVVVALHERHGYQGLNDVDDHPDAIAAAQRHLGEFRARKRHFESIEGAFSHTSDQIVAASSDLGTAWACDLFFTAEREYWQSRNAAARVQYEGQNRLGLGWANHDHHTYRSSRRAFRCLVGTLEQLGFVCRERFYAGSEAGWGAQVLEQPDCRLVVFADVDLSPAEVAGDFAHQPLAERDQLGTVGLWCELHGEAFLEAGMHHLECQFDFDAARMQLAAVGVETLAPFTDFPFLKQAFTRGETWSVDPRRIDRLLATKRITDDEAERFRRDGAVGSHLEILERNDGYKGFNQTGISEIISRTDPRRMIGA